MESGGGVKPSKCTKACVQKQCFAGITLSLSFQSLSTQPLSAIRNMIVHVFCWGVGVGGGVGGLSNQEGGRRSKAQMGAKQGQRNRCPQFHLSVQATPTLAAILHFSSK